MLQVAGVTDLEMTTFVQHLAYLANPLAPDMNDTISVCMAWFLLLSQTVQLGLNAVTH